jgi:hypothetical protein
MARPSYQPFGFLFDEKVNSLKIPQEFQVCIVQIFCPKGGQTLLSLLGMREKKFSFHFNIIISQSVRSTFAKLFSHFYLLI